MLRRLSDFDAARTRNLILGMTEVRQDRGYDFNPEWIAQRRWCVVPVEDSGHFAGDEIRCIVPALNMLTTSCLVIAVPDLPTEFANVYEMSVSEESFEVFNAEFGIFRSLLTDSHLSWAISCNEWFNLFAGPESLIEQVLGVPIDEARRDFLAYAELVEHGGSGGLLEVAQQYR